ncbi:hypothetical protein Hanom_Chr11g01018701 [Helianthus anomalus]
MMNEVKKTTDENLEKMVDEGVTGEQQVKKADAKAEEAVVEKQQVNKEDQKKKAEEARVPNAECKKCMERCKACTEKDNNMRSKDIEFTKIEKIFNEKCNEMLDNERFLKEKEKQLI